jgi:hypothetical protein
MALGMRRSSGYLRTRRRLRPKHGLDSGRLKSKTQIERIRAAANGEGQPLTKLNALALAGRWYLWYVARHESDPGSPEHWADRKLTERVWYPHAPLEHHEDPNADTTWPWTQWPEVREAVRPEVAEMALAATFLASEGLALIPTQASCSLTQFRNGCSRHMRMADDHS